MQLILKFKNGFTLVETLVAIAVLLLVIIGPMTIAQKGIQNAQYANEQLTAVFLAQEAIEAMRQLRDDVALDRYHGDTSVHTLDWTPDECTGGCIYDFRDTQDNFLSCSSGNSCAKLYVDSSTGLYSHDSGDSVSPFSRTVTIDKAYIGTGGVLVTVDVSWNGRVFNNTTRHVTLQTYIYDHYQRYEN